MIIKTSKQLKSRYHDLGPGDVFIGTLVYKHLKPSVFIDLLERGVTCLPSPLSQNLNSSKAAQAFVLKDWMLPHTAVITRRMDLIETINQYNKHGITAIVTKEDHLHCGHGIRRWDNIEALYSLIALVESSYPFIVQPFLENFTDVRVIMVGNFVEAYVRHNPDNFRMNISFGGKPRPYNLNEAQEKFCRTAMERGKFPYAHMDLQVLENNHCYLSEIALNGGIKGARIDRKELEQKKRKLLKKLANS